MGPWRCVMKSIMLRISSCSLVYKGVPLSLYLSSNPHPSLPIFYHSKIYRYLSRLNCYSFSSCHNSCTKQPKMHYQPLLATVLLSSLAAAQPAPPAANELRFDLSQLNVFASAKDGRSNFTGAFLILDPATSDPLAACLVLDELAGRDDFVSRIRPRFALCVRSVVFSVWPWERCWLNNRVLRLFACRKLMPSLTSRCSSRSSLSRTLRSSFVTLSKLCSFLPLLPVVTYSKTSTHRTVTS